MANNTVASGYIEQLTDLLCVAPSYAWDASLKKFNRRRPCKLHFTNLLAATAWHPAHLRCPADFHALPPEHQAVLMEWTVTQECWRRSALQGDEIPERSSFWQSDKHELDFVLSPDEFIEVKRGRAGPLDFGWFTNIFPNARLKVVSASRFETDSIEGITLQDFLLETGEANPQSSMSVKVMTCKMSSKMALYSRTSKASSPCSPSLTMEARKRRPEISRLFSGAYRTIAARRASPVTTNSPSTS